MRRELGALLLLAALIGASVWSIRRVDALTAEAGAHLERSEKALLSGDRRNAEAELDAALRIWRCAGGYTEVFLRHSELDSIRDAFYTLQREVRAGEGKELTALYELLEKRLDCLASMEHVSLGSVF